MISEPMQRLQELFAVLDADTEMALDAVYTDDVEFRDPFHAVDGRAALQAYFGRMNQKIQSCRFEFHDTVENDTAGFTTWRMSLVMKQGPKGAIEVDGTTHVRFRDGLVCYHRDYFDAADLVYEHIPIMGSVIRAIRKRV